MKHKLFILCCSFMLAVGAKPVSAQVVFDVETIDWIVMGKDERLRFFEQKGNQYREVKLYFDDNLYHRKREPGISRGDWTTSSPIDSAAHAINVKDIKSYSPKALLRHLTKYQFKSTTTYNGDTAFTYLQLFNPYLILITEKHRPQSRYSRADYGLGCFCILKLCKNKRIVLFSHLGYGGYDYYIPGKKKEQLFIPISLFPKQDLVTEKADKNWNTDGVLGNIFAYMDKYFDYNKIYNFDYDYGNPDDTTDDKMTLMGYYGENLSHGAKYDLLEHKSYFILATENKQTEVYNFFLERVADNVRSYTTNNESKMLLNILKGDSVYTIDYRGDRRNPKKMYFDYTPLVPHYYPPYNDPKTQQRVRKTSDNYYIFTTRLNNGYYNFKAKSRIQLPEGTTSNDISNMGHFSYKDDCKAFWLKKNDHIGLYFIKFPPNPVDRKIVKENNLKRPNGDTVYQASPVVAQELIPITMDSLKAVVYPKLKQLLMYKDGMVGVYPFQSEPKYRSINPKPQGGFLRYTLPDGRKGWLNLQTGKEFLDE